MSNQIIIKNKVEALVITTRKDMEGAVELLSLLNRYLDELTEEREKVTKPLNEALRNERARFKPREVELEAMIAKIREQMGRYQSAQLRLKKIEEDKIAKQLSDGKITFDEASKIMGEGDEVDDKIESKSGSVAFRVDKVLKIVNTKKIPREYLVADEKRILEDLKKGIEIAGCTLEERQTVINRR